MDKRYTEEEIGQIQALTEGGHTIQEIAEAVGRPAAGIRNIRHRNKLKAKTRQSLESLRYDETRLIRQVKQLRRDIQTLETRKETLRKTLLIDEENLKVKLQTALRKLKDQRPKLFNITFEEQIGKLTAELSISLLRWLIS